MSLSNLQHIICEKEKELTQIRKAAADAAQHQEEESRVHLLHVIETMELELEHVRRESEHLVEQATKDADRAASAKIECDRKELEREMQVREDEIFRLASSKMEEEWAAREDGLRQEFQSVLSAELRDQHSRHQVDLNQLAAHYDTIIQEHEKAMADYEESTRHQMSSLEEQHRAQLDSASEQIDNVAQKVWSDACEHFNAAAEDTICTSLAATDERCNAKENQISDLLTERSELQQQLSDKDSQLQDCLRDMGNMEDAMDDAALQMHRCHEEEVARLSDEIISLVSENKALQVMQSENDLLKRELTECRSRCKAIEAKCADQKEAVSGIDEEKVRSQRRVGELSACNQLLECQLLESRKENQQLSTNTEGLLKKIDELEAKNEDMSVKVTTAVNRIGELQRKNHDLERKCDSATAQVKSLEVERREYMIDMEDRIRRKDNLLAETIHAGSKPRTDPVVVHVNGGSDNTSNNDKLSSECHSLRSKVLQLQRENFRLENELLGVKRRGRADDTADRLDEVGSLRKENKGLKTIISMMRQEMEAQATDNNAGCSDTAVEKPPSDYGVTTAREKELIQKLEEAADEIEELLQENEKLMILSNELRFELQRRRSQSSSPARPGSATQPEHRHESQSGELLDAILNDQSRSCSDSVSQLAMLEDDVACVVGQKPPMSSCPADHVPSRNAYVSVRIQQLEIILSSCHCRCALSISSMSRRPLPCITSVTTGI